MKKSSYNGYWIFGILFSLISVVAFIVPTLKNATFWIAYGFTVIAFVSHTFIWRKAFSENKTLKSKFLRIPVLYIGIVYLILQSVSFGVFTALPLLPLWIVIVADSIILAICAVCMITEEIGRNEIDSIEEEVQKKVSYLRELQAEVEQLAESEKDSQTKLALEQLAENIRYSDPMSCEELVDIETKISLKTKGLKTASDKGKVSEEIALLLVARNKKCKLLK